MRLARFYSFRRTLRCGAPRDMLIDFIRSNSISVSIETSANLPNGTTFLSSIHGGFASISVSPIVNRSTFSQLVAPRLLIHVVSREETSLMKIRVSAVSALSVAVACIAVGCVGVALVFISTETSSLVAFALVLAVLGAWVIALVWWRHRNYVNSWRALATWGGHLITRLHIAGIATDVS